MKLRFSLAYGLIISASSIYGVKPKKGKKEDKRRQKNKQRMKKYKEKKKVGSGLLFLSGSNTQESVPIKMHCPNC